jgi:DnaJ-class molecular chaperone
MTEDNKKAEKQCDIHVVVLQSEQLKCPCCNGTGYVEGEYIRDKEGCLTCNGRGHFN